MSNTVNVSTTTNQVVITPQSTKTVSVNSGGGTSLTVNQGSSNTITVSDNVVNTSLTPNTVNITTPPSNGITVTDLRKTITVNQGTTSVVNVNTVDPQGPKGDTGATGPQGPTQDTGSLLTTASYSNPNLTLTKGDGSIFNVEISTTTPTLAEVTAQGSSTTTAITASIISASGDITANLLTVSTSSVQDTYMMFIPRTSDGIANRSSYFLSFNPTVDALKHSNFGANFNMSSSLYFNRVIACDDMSIASGKSIDMTGILHVEGATFSSNQVQIDLYTASITPNNTSRLPEPLEFTRAFVGDSILIDATSPNSSSHHFTQSFDISTLSPNSLIAVALSNSSPSTPVTTNTNVNLSLRLTRNYKKKN